MNEIQSCDQKLIRMNKALAMNCNAIFNAEKGADAEDDWQKGKPVRVVRNYKLGKHSEYAPKDGNRYDGIYKVVKYYPEKGKSGYIVWRYLLRRDDEKPAPWEKGGQAFDMLYPPGYLEAQKEKNPEQPKKRKSVLKDISKKMSTKRQKLDVYQLNSEVAELIKNDEANNKLWSECNEYLNSGKQEYLKKVQDIFICICCQEVAYKPVTTECKHNICISCLKRSFLSEIYTCPYCRFNLGSDYNMKINKSLSKALLLLLPGYDSGR